MKWNVLVSAPYMQQDIEQYRPSLEDYGINLIVPPVRERLSEEELLKSIPEIDGVISGDDAFTEKVLLAAPRLKVISKWGTGIDSINLEAANRLGIAVCNTPDAFTNPVSDSVLGYILSFARQIPFMDRDIRSGIWQKRPGFCLNEATLGVIGIGNIGQAVLRRASAFGMKLLGYDTRPVPKTFAVEVGLELVDKSTLLAQSDFVSLNCDLNDTSLHIIDEAELNQMKSTSYLINLARGPLINETALVEALKLNKIAGAALDVFEDEPIPADSGLLTLGNCLMAPHNSNSSPSAYKRVHETSIQNLLDNLQ